MNPPTNTWRYRYVLDTTIRKPAHIFMSYLRYMSLFTYCGVQHISVSPGVCRRIHVLFTLFMFVYVLWCTTYLYLQVFVGGFMSYLRYMSLFTYCGVQHISVSTGVNPPTNTWRYRYMLDTTIRKQTQIT
jgi:hypothetical protein